MSKKRKKLSEIPNLDFIKWLSDITLVSVQWEFYSDNIFKCILSWSILLSNIGERGHVIEKSRNTKTDTEEQKQDFFGIDEGIIISNIPVSKKALASTRKAFHV